MLTALHSAADAVLKRIRRSPLYYRRYNNTLSFRINKAYVDYARECSERYVAEHGPVNLPPSPLLHDPAIVIRGAFPPEKARALSAKIGDLIAREDPCVYHPLEEHGGSRAEQIRSPLKSLGVEILDVMRSPELHKALLQFFRSHYRVKGTAAWRSYPTSDPDCASWLWHSDTYPPFTCKFFLHLTAADGQTGATEFMNREDTMAYRRAGYFGQFSDERRSDLEVFAKENGITYRPVRIDVQPGDVTIFNENFFHRAVPPRKDFRDVVQFLMLPSPVSWEEDYARDPARLNDEMTDFAKDPRAGESCAGSSMMM